MRKFIHHIALFAVVFSAIQFVGNLTFLKKIGNPYAHNKRYTTQYAAYLENESRYNTLFMGSSRTYRQINPGIIDSLSGNQKIKSFNLGAIGTFHPENLYLLEEFIKNKSTTAPVKYVFMELTDLVPIDFVNWFAPQSYYYIDTKYLRFVLSYYFNRKDYSIIQKIKYAYPFLQGYMLNHLFLVNPLHVTPEDEVYTGENKDGFYPLDLDAFQNKKEGLLERYAAFQKDTSGLTQRIQNQYSDKIPQVNPALASRLMELMSQADRHDIQLYFIIPPRLKEYKDMVALKALLLPERVIDMGSHSEYPDLYLVKNSFDVAHLNSQGAKIYSTYLAKAIRAKLFPSDGNAFDWPKD